MLERNRHLVFFTLLFIALSGAGIFYLQRPASTPIEILPSKEAVATAVATPTVAPTATPVGVRVYVTGAIIQSDVYVLPQGSIIKDAILAAGGFTPDADLECINQALELKDQQQIHVPRIGETDAPPPVQGGITNNEQSRGNSISINEGLININTATLEELDQLPGIGPAIGQRIIDYREHSGGFTTVQDITQVSGIGQATFAKIKEKITVQ